MSVESINYQEGWRQCGKCLCLFFGESPSEGGFFSGVCVDGLAHQSTANKFKIPFAGPGFSGQTNWRYCFKCVALFFNGHQSKGFCGADKSGHSSYGSGNYELKYTANPSLGNLYGWRWCRQCEQIFFCPFQECVTVCAAGGSHDKSESGFYFIDW
jgi:hypothetical protein